MAHDAEVTGRIGESALIYGEANSSGGALSFSNGNFTLYGPDGNPVDNLVEVTLSGHDPDGGTQMRAWYNLDFSLLQPDTTYIGEVRFSTVNAQDGMTRNHVASTLIVVLPHVEVTASYDLTTKAGKTRFWLQDFHTRPPVWGDDEIENYLRMSTPAGTVEEGNPILAAALAYELKANDAAGIASVKKIAIFQVDNRNLPNALREAAKNLRDLLLIYGMDGDGLPDEDGIIAFVGGVTPSVELFPRKRSDDFYDSYDRW